MADINLPNDAIDDDPKGGGRDGDADREEILELIELLFFAYRDFTSDPDAILAGYGFGRAHHRVVHFVGRNPGIRVAELLEILRITKQSLGRVLRELIETGFVYQREGREDRRQRLLHLTERGEDLMRSLQEPQIARVRAALERSGPMAESVYRKVLFNLIDGADHDMVRKLTAGSKAE
jgi:DNA-binding MarR family transcriptional regulator